MHTRSYSLEKEKFDYVKNQNVSHIKSLHGKNQNYVLNFEMFTFGLLASTATPR